MVELYGGDFIGHAQDGLLWANEMTITPSAPMATWTGVAYRGHLKFHQLSTALTLGNLIKSGRQVDAYAP
jgi:hypothetical protein